MEKVPTHKLPLIVQLSIGKEKEFFVENLALLLSSGMDIIQILRSVKIEVRSRFLKKIIEHMEDDIESGSSLWRALEKSGLFPTHIISLIRIGEQSGQLPENLKVIALQQQKEQEFRSKVKSAMMYPMIILTFTVIVGFGIAWFILPRLANVFTQLKLPLPLITRMLIIVGDFLGRYGTIAVPASIAGLVAIVYFLFGFPKTKGLGQTLLLGFPGVRRLIQEVELARFGFILGTLLGAGMPVIDSLESLAQATSVLSFKKLYRHIKDSIEEGNSFQKSFELYSKSRKLIPSPIQQLIVSAEKSGRLPETLHKIGEIYEGKTEITTKNLTVLLEPILLIAVWIGVVFVALAVIMPIYSLIGGLNQASSTSTPSIQSPASTPTKTTQATETPSTEPSSPPAEPVGQSEPTPAPQPTPEPEPTPPVKKVEILQTEVGFLNVRPEPSTKSGAIAKVKPGEIYEYRDVQNEWYQIVLADGQLGWVRGQYVKTVDQ